jgi:hypothetical protein
MAAEQYAPEPRLVELKFSRHATVTSNLFVETKSAMGAAANEYGNRHRTISDVLKLTGMEPEIAYMSSKNDNPDHQKVADAYFKAKTKKKYKKKMKDNLNKKKRAAIKEASSKSSESLKAKVGKVSRMYCGCKFGISKATMKSGAGWRRNGIGKVFQSEPAMAYHILMNNASCLPADLYHRESFEPYADRLDLKYGMDYRMKGVWDEEIEAEEEEVRAEVGEENNDEEGVDTDVDDDDDSEDDDETVEAGVNLGIDDAASF